MSSSNWPPVAPPRRWQRRTRAALAAGGLLLGALLLAALLGAWLSIRHHARALPNVHLAGIDVSGLTVLEMEALLADRLDPAPCTSVEVRIDDVTYSLTADEVGHGYRVDDAIARAMAAGRGDADETTFLEPLVALFDQYSVGIELVSHEPDLLAAAAERIALEHQTEPIDAVVTKQPSGFAMLTATEGRRIDPASLAAAIREQLDTLAGCTVITTDQAVPAVVSTEEAEAITAAATRMTTALTLADGDETFSISGDVLYEAISLVRGGDEADGELTIEVDAEAIEAAVAAMADDVNREPLEAAFELGPRGVSGVVAGHSGRELDVAATTEAVLAELEARRTGPDMAEQVEIVAAHTDPKVSTELAQATFDQLSLIGSWTTHFVPNDGNGFGANIHIGADDLDGYVLAPGAQLDFWDAIGPVTEARGYTYGGVIIDGRSVAGGAIGGGICSTSTTLFNAALRAGLQIDSRAAHAYFIDRYPVGLDATVWATESAEQSMVFTNDTDHPIIIRGYTDDADSVTFELWGVADGRTVALSDPIVTDRETAVDFYEDTTELAPGVEQRVEFPHDGFRSVVTRKVTAADGSVLHQDTFNSHYRTVDGIILRGVAG